MSSVTKRLRAGVATTADCHGRLRPARPTVCIRERLDTTHEVRSPWRDFDHRSCAVRRAGRHQFARAVTARSVADGSPVSFRRPPVRWSMKARSNLLWLSMHGPPVAALRSDGPRVLYLWVTRDTRSSVDVASSTALGERAAISTTSHFRPAKSRQFVGAFAPAQTCRRNSAI